MWCTRCHADVAAELAENGQALHCASCGHEIQKIYTPSLHPETRTARELLERWSREERIAPPPPASLTSPPSDDLGPSTAPDRNPLSIGEFSSPANELNEPEPLLAPEPAAARAPSLAPTSRQEPGPSRLISTNITAGPVSQPAPLVAPESMPLRDAVPPPPGAPVPSAESTGDDVSDGKPRRKLERPVMSRTSKPKGVWRADSAHVPSTDSVGDEVPRSVASLESIETKIPAPSSPPVRPPRASFAALAASLGVSPSAPAAPASAAPPAFSSASRPTEVASRSESTRAERASSPVSSEVRSASTSERSGSRPRKLRRRMDPAQSGPAQPPRPHFDLQTYLEQNPQRVGRSETLWGQLVAYAGVAVLTIGTTMVLWGYFGGLGRYSSTGFLISTAGQMLLFLGVVTLVSGGMQQTSHEVTTRVEYLGDRMIRMEQATQQVLRSPHFARRRNRRSRPTSGVSVPRSEGQRLQ